MEINSNRCFPGDHIFCVKVPFAIKSVPETGPYPHSFIFPLFKSHQESRITTSQPSFFRSQPGGFHKKVRLFFKGSFGGRLVTRDSTCAGLGLVGNPLYEEQKPDATHLKRRQRKHQLYQGIFFVKQGGITTASDLKVVKST